MNFPSFGKSLRTDHLATGFPGQKPTLMANALRVLVDTASSQSKSLTKVVEERGRVCGPQASRNRNVSQFALATGGTFHVPFRIEGDASFGQYIRSIGMNSPFGAGSQLASLSAPGDSFWK